MGKRQTKEKMKTETFNEGIANTSNRSKVHKVWKEQQQSNGTTTVFYEPQFKMDNEELTQLTEEPEVKKILQSLYKKANNLQSKYKGRKDSLIRDTADSLEDYMESKKGEAYADKHRKYISGIISHALKTHAKGFATDRYVRKVLDDRFKEVEKNRAKASVDGMVKDSGRTMEELLEGFKRDDKTTFKDLLKKIKEPSIMLGKYYLQGYHIGHKENMKQEDIERQMNEVVEVTIKEILQTAEANFIKSVEEVLKQS